MSVDAWRTGLAEVDQLGGVLCTAIERDDVITAIATTCQLRRTRAALARIDAVAPTERRELATLADVAELVVRVRAVEEATRCWLQRPLPGDGALLATPLGTAVLADALLPEVWDFETDLVVLVGGELAPVAAILADLGQRRVVTLGFTAGDAISVASVDELAVAVRTLVPQPPARFVLRAGHGAVRADVEHAVEIVETTLGDLRIHRNTVRAFSRTWIEQGVQNLPALAHWPSVAALDGRLAGKPMVIVAPGPSLARNVDQLRALQGRAVITAFSHSLRPVLAAGVTPDFVVTVDPQDVRYHFAGCDVSRSCLVNAATVHPSLFELPAARFLSLSANCAIDDWLFDALGEEALVPGGGSVATSAFSLALRWGCDPIVFVGLDLSFPGGNYYVSTCSDGGVRARADGDTIRVEGWSRAFESMKARGGPAVAGERAVELPGWHGGTVPSSFMFALFHRWFVDRMKSVTARVYNCTEGGAHIAGMQHVPLAEVAFGDVFEVPVVEPAARTQRVADHFRGYVTRLRRCERLAHRAQRLIDRGEVGKPLARIERALATALEPLAFASLLAQREVDRAHDVARRAGTAVDLLAATRSLLATLRDVIGQLEPALAGALERLHA